MSPAQQRLADALEVDKASTLLFMREVFKLGKEYDGVSLSEMTAAVQEYVQRFDRRPTPEDVIEHICMQATDRVLERVEARMKDEAGNRPLDPQWTIPGFDPQIVGRLSGNVFKQATASAPEGAVPEEAPASQGHAVDSQAEDLPGRWKQRLAHVLGLNGVAAEAFVSRVFTLRHRGERFGLADLFPVVEAMKRRGESVTPEALYVHLRALSDQRKKEDGANGGESAKRGTRNHVSVWEIRN